jgi:hypothetical protein
VVLSSGVAAGVAGVDVLVVCDVVAVCACAADAPASRSAAAPPNVVTNIRPIRLRLIPTIWVGAAGLKGVAELNSRAAG